MRALAAVAGARLLRSTANIPRMTPETVARTGLTGAYDEADDFGDGDYDLTGDGGGDDLSLPAAGDDLGDASSSRLDSLSKRDVQRMSDEEILQFAKGADPSTLRKSLLLQAGFTQRMQKLSELEGDLKKQQTRV